MSDLTVLYKSVEVPSEYHTNLDSPGFAHWCRGVDAARLSAPPEPTPGYEYYSDQDANPHTYFRRFEPGQDFGDFLGGSGGSWVADEDTARSEIGDLYDYVKIAYADLPAWAKNAPTRD